MSIPTQMTEGPYQQFKRLELPLFDTIDLRGTPEHNPSRASLMPHCFTTARSPSPQQFGVFLGWGWGMIAQNGFVDAAMGLSTAQKSTANLFEIDHQGGGHNCYPIACVGRPIEITSEFEGFAAGLCADYNLSGHWLMPSTHPEKRPHYKKHVRIYRARLAESGYMTITAFAEGQLGLIEAMYPFDATWNNLTIIARNPERELRALAPLLAHQALAKSMLILVVADSLD
jgi:hypothetical protein